jgi:alkylglycerol monooxygenase
METYGQLLNISMPIFLGLFLLEYLYDWRRGTGFIKPLDSISSLSSGMTNVVKDVLGLSIVILGYDWLVNHLAIFRPEAAVWMYFVAFIAKDFQGYWTHRWSHVVNFMWNRHIIHHSSEEFNLACALRQSVSEVFNYFSFMLLPCALLGVPTNIIAIVGPLHLFLQFWYHTRHINRMGWLEKVLVTPSHHRVHHAINPMYMDKNYGQIFIFWDRWFGTFQEELAAEPAVYGVSRAVKTWNPIRINFQHFQLLFTDAVYAKNWIDKLKVWIAPTGWRPADRAQLVPVDSIKDVVKQEKYQGKPTQLLLVWSWVQMLLTYVLLVYLFSHLSQWPVWAMMTYGAFVFLHVWSYTELMDGAAYSFETSILKAIIALTLINQMGGQWFYATGLWSWLTLLVTVMVVASVAVTYQVCKEQKLRYG